MKICCKRNYLSVEGKGTVHPCIGTEALYRSTAHRESRGIALL